jgi:transposase
MVVPPTPEEEDRRRISRECKVLLEERIKHVNRIKGLLASQGITSYQPLRRDRHQRLDELQTRDGRPLPTHLKSQILREIERMEMLLRQIVAVEEVRDTLVCPDSTETPAVLLTRLRGIGPEFATVLWLEGFFRHFGNRRQLAEYCGLAPALGKAARLTAIKASRKRAIRACAQRRSNWPGYGSAINRTRRSVNGFASASVPSVAEFDGSRSSRWPASSWWRSGGT